MRGRGSTTDRLERELRDKRTRLEQEERNGESELRLASTVGDERLDEAAADLLADRIDEAEYARVEADVAKARGGHAANAGRHARVGALLRQEIAALERRLEEAPFEAILERRPECAAALQAASVQLAKSLRATAAAAEKVAAKRAELDAVDAEAKALRPSWRDDELSAVDEAAWPDVKLLVKLLKEGRRDSAAREAERVRRRDEDAARANARRVPNLVEMIVKGGLSRADLWARFDALAEEEQAEVLRQAEAALDRVEVEIRAEFRHPDALPGQELREQARVERVREAIEDRIGWLREGTVPGPVVEPFEVFAGGRL
jgi:hypothetical protein